MFGSTSIREAAISTAKPIQVLTGAWLAALLWASPSAASPDYPEVISQQLGTPCVPQCRLCHRTNPGNAGTTDSSKPFFISMRAQGLQPGSADTLRTALAALVSNMTDSDMDMVPDTVELNQERDPNVSGEGQLCGGPTYGCGARIARDRMVEPVALGAALGAALVLVLARRLRHAG